MRKCQQSSMTTIGVDIRVLGTGRTSGVEVYTDRITERMTALAPNIRWKLFYAGRRPLARSGWMTRPNISVYETGLSNRLLQIRTWLTGRPYLDKLIGGVDTFFFPHVLAGATSLGVRRVLTMHDLSYERMPELFSVRRRAWHQLQMRPRRAARRADAIIAVSASTAADVQALYRVAPERVSVIHSGVDVRRPTDDEVVAFRRQKNLTGPYILALGTIEPRKNLEALVMAFEHIATRLPTTTLVIGGSRGWLWKPVMNLVKRSPVRNRIRILDTVEPTERERWYAAASVLAYPSLLEGFGFPPLEAFACGTPVVAAANSSLFETVGEAALLVNPYSVGELSVALEAVLTDETLQERLVGKGRGCAQRFSWDQAARATLDVLQ